VEVGLARRYSERGKAAYKGKGRGRARLAEGHITCTHGDGSTMSTQLSQIALKARWDQKARFTSLAHLLTPDFLKETWAKMNRKAASGIDGESCEQFESELDQRVQELCERLRAGTYRAPPVRRVEIPKGPGKTGTRPLGIPTVADRLLQRSVARILEAVFEADFLDCSYGFRPGRSPHHALRALRTRIVTGKVRHVAEADIRGYFTHISHSWLRQMVAHRIVDPVILSLIGKWLNAGVMHDGVLLKRGRRKVVQSPASSAISTCIIVSTCGLKRSSSRSVKARHIWCASLMTSWGASKTGGRRMTFSGNYESGLQSST